MKKFLQITFVALLAVFCVSCGNAGEVATYEKPVSIQEEKEVATPKETQVQIESNEKAVISNDTPIKKNICTLEIRCDTILKNMDKLHPSKQDFVPSDGIIFSKSEIEFDEGESAFQVLLRVTRENKIHMEFVNTPGLNSSYVEGIANIYEFDCGAESGWMYNVNGKFPSVGSSAYIINDGDTISYLYTINRGHDIGGYVEE